MDNQYRSFTTEQLLEEYKLQKSLQNIENVKAVLGEALRRKEYLSHDANTDTEELFTLPERLSYYEDESVLRNLSYAREFMEETMKELASWMTILADKSREYSELASAIQDNIDAWEDIKMFEAEISKRGLKAAITLRGDREKEKSAKESARQEELLRASGSFLRELREKHGMSQKDLASAMGYGDSDQIDRFERGEMEMRISALRKLEEIFGLTNDEILKLLCGDMNGVDEK